LFQFNYWILAKGETIGAFFAIFRRGAFGAANVDFFRRGAFGAVWIHFFGAAPSAPRKVNHLRAWRTANN
jgi:hypothetical protein